MSEWGAEELKALLLRAKELLDAKASCTDARFDLGYDVERPESFEFALWSVKLDEEWEDCEFRSDNPIDAVQRGIALLQSLPDYEDEDDDGADPDEEWERLPCERCGAVADVDVADVEPLCPACKRPRESS